MANYIYITKESKKELISSINLCETFGTIKNNRKVFHPSKKLIFKKKYPKINPILRTMFIPDLSDIIMTYVNDIIEIEYCISIGDTIQILFEYTIMNFHEYNFKYMLTRIEEGHIAIISNTCNNVYECYLGESVIFEYDYDNLKNVYIDVDNSVLINEFMSSSYQKHNYVNDNNHRLIELIGDRYVIRNKSNQIVGIFKILDKRKMKNMTIIIKIIIDIFKKIDNI